LAPSFGDEKNSGQALKVAVYAYTPAWVAGVLQVLPPLRLLAILDAQQRFVVRTERRCR
jgi:hypothetical protein